MGRDVIKFLNYSSLGQKDDDEKKKSTTVVIFTDDPFSPSDFLVFFLFQFIKLKNFENELLICKKEAFFIIMRFISNGKNKKTGMICWAL